MDHAHVQRRRGVTIVGHIVLAFFALLALAGLTAYVYALAFLKAGPVLDANKLDLQQSVRILDRNGGELYQFSGGENRLYLPSEEIPVRAKRAIVAIEDERFFTRSTCIDLRADLRALKSTVLDHRLEGASTLTQQLTRMLYLSPERTITRKLYEISLSCRLEHLLTKDQILSLYLNGVSFGNGLSGIEQASEAYFGIPATKLSLAQTAVLVSIPQRPSYFSPYGPHVQSSVDAETLRAIRRGDINEKTLDPAKVEIGLLPRDVQGKAGLVRIAGRSDLVLRAMLRLQFITQKDFAAAEDDLKHIEFRPFGHPIVAPHFALWIRSEIESLLSSLDAPLRWEAAGLTVRTTLDPTLQRIAENTVEDSQALLQSAGAKNVALLAIDRRTRQVLAYVGNNDFFATDAAGQIDMVRTPRQPGSSFKPLVYSLAFERGFTPDTIVLDEPMHIGGDVPKNYEGGYRGPITVREALARSRNIPAIRTFLDIGGEEPALDLAGRVGLTTPVTHKQEMQKTNPSFTYGWPMAIGSIEVPLLEMIQLYATIADHGVFKPLKELCSVEGRNGDGVLPVPEQFSAQAIDREAADGVDSILRDGKSRPEGFWRNMLTIPWLDTGAKTGTSNVCFLRDAFGRCTQYGVNNVWTLGYSDQLVVGVWVGNADNAALDPLADGLTVAAPIWRRFLEQASVAYRPQQAECD